MESAIAPQVVQQALERGIIFSGLVCDGDTKTHVALNHADIYRDIDNSVEIQRIECLAHVCRRLKAYLLKKHEREMNLVKAGKDADIRRMARQGASSNEITKLVAASGGTRISNTRFLNFYFYSKPGYFKSKEPVKLSQLTRCYKMNTS